MALVSVADYAKRASEIIPRNALEFYRTGAGDGLTLKLNRTCYDRLRIRPRVLRSGAERDMSVELFGQKYAMPIGISPTAAQRMAHPDGEVANAKAAASRGIGFTLATMANFSIEEVAAVTPDLAKWLQVFIFKDQLTAELVRRAENAGFKAIVLTVDAPLVGLRRSDMRDKFRLAPHYRMSNFKRSTESENNKHLGANQLKPDVCWNDVKWLINFTKLPVILKGILTREDAIIGADLGAQGIWVSNHGGRQVDSVPASIEALPEIAAAVGDRVTIVIDGGVRQGTDVFKALALGAKMVLFGRPALWGLAVDGQKGVENILDLMRKELDIAMALAGCQSVAEISQDRVVHESYFAKL